MPADNPLQFAVVREDPRVELEVLARLPRRRLLLIASGGCTALALAPRLPQAEITLLDPNPAQLAHVQDKLRKLEDLEGEALRRLFSVGVGVSTAGGLSERGNFESLFRGLRRFLHDLVAPREAWVQFFHGRGDPAAFTRQVFESRYWPVAFELFFSDALLVAMFGPDAVQHAAPGSYPGYFRRRLEDGLTRQDARDNPFLQHIFLGAYAEHSPPDFLRAPLLAAPAGSRLRDRFRWIEGDLGAVDFADYDFIGLSNVLDWMAPEAVSALLERLRAAPPGAVVLWRQLNNGRDLEAQLADTFDFERAWAADLHARDRSLFYSSLHLGVRREGV